MKKTININVSTIKGELAAIKKELLHLLDGKLYMRKTFFFYKIGRKEVGITKKPDLIHQLCRRAYLNLRKSQLENNLNHPVVKHNSKTPQQLIAELPNAYQSVPETYFHHPSVERFRSKPPRMNSLYQENAKYIHNGVAYRSMSEREIAQKLTENNIPFYYDACFSTGANDLSPDFYIINPFTGKYFLWEHFGSFHIPSYGERMNDKLATYAEIDFVENDNLIVTFEYHLRDTNRIQAIIDQVIWS